MTASRGRGSKSRRRAARNQSDRGPPARIVTPRASTKELDHVHPESFARRIGSARRRAGARARRCARSQATGKPAAPPAPEVTVAGVIAKPLRDWEEFTGRLQAVDSVEIRPRVNGFIDSVQFTEGTRVKKGQPSVRLGARMSRSINLARSRRVLTLATEILNIRAVSSMLRCCTSRRRNTSRYFCARLARAFVSKSGISLLSRASEGISRQSAKSRGVYALRPLVPACQQSAQSALHAAFVVACVPHSL